MTRADVKPIRRGYSYHVIRCKIARSQTIKFGSRSRRNVAGFPQFASRSTANLFRKYQRFGSYNVERSLKDGILHKSSPKITGNNTIYDQNGVISISIFNMGKDSWELGIVRDNLYLSELQYDWLLSRAQSWPAPEPRSLLWKVTSFCGEIWRL